MRGTWGTRNSCLLKMRFTNLITTLALAALAAPLAHAYESITLSNGFVERCDHHMQIDGRVRLYLSHGEDSYIEIAPQQIVAVETVAEPPASAPQPQTVARLSAADLGQIMARAGQEHNIDVDLLASVVKAESSGNAHAVSRTGARGLMQLMPGTAAGLGVSDSFAPDQNVRGGSAYLDALLLRYHDNLALALAAYNAGPQAVDKYRGIPPYHETRAYVARVIHEFNRRVLAREAQARMAATTASSH